LYILILKQFFVIYINNKFGGSKAEGRMLLIGEHLRRARLARGLTMRELAEMTGLRPALISNLENNRQSGLYSDTLIKLCRALGVTSDYLLGLWEDWDPGQKEGQEENELLGAVAL
jgi:transcriptional regulator with XRE-family HTH domain